MLIWLALLLIAESPADSTSTRPITQLVHRTWTAKDGAPTDIRALAQTTDGYLWIGTRSGLVRFDGVRFVEFAPRAGDTLPTGGVHSLTSTRDGSLWISWLNGRLSRLRDGRLTSYGERDGMSRVFAVAESSSGIVVAGTVTGIALFANGTWRDVSHEWGYPGTECPAVWFDREGALWAETERRVVYLPSGSSRFVDPGMPLKQQAGQAQFAEAKDGTIWMAELQRSAHTIPRLGDPTPVTEVMVGTWTLLIDRKGTLWIGSAGDGLRRVRDPNLIRGRKIAQFGSRAEQFTEKEGLLSNVVYALLEDGEGDVWVATIRGLERFREGAFTPIATPGSVRARTIFATRDSSVWTTGFNMGDVSRLRPDGSQMVIDNGIAFVLTALAQDRSGIPLTFDKRSIYRLEGRRFIAIPLRAATGRHLEDLTVDRTGAVWVFDEELGLLRLTGDSLTRVASIGQPGFMHAYLMSDRRGRIWIGQQNRVAMYDHGRVKIFAAAHGEGPADINCFFEDRFGNVWVASDGGMSKYESGRFRAVPERQSLPGRTVFGIAEDDGGAWWVLTRGGVLRLPAGELERALADSAYRVRYRIFDQRDGLPGMITASNWGPELIRAADGRIWVATDSGLAWVDPGNLPLERTPQVLIEGARINARALPPSDTAKIAPKSGDLEIDYTATNLSSPERVEFRYQLVGEDHEWREVGTQRRAYYAHLPPGAYTFRVTANSADGNWSKAGAEWNFRVLPAWYQTLWLRAAVILLIGGLGATGAAMVQRRRHWRLEETLKSQYEATLAERARIAQDLHDTLLQGFAGVTLLLKTAELALPEQPDVAAETLLRVHRLARASLSEARERVWDMRESQSGNEDLPAALETCARERTAASGIEVSVSIVGRRRRLARSVEDAAFRIGREAIVNAVRHAEAHRIEIEVAFEPATLRLRVRDNGRGFAIEEAEDARQKGHFGLSGARERAMQLGGRCEVLTGAAGGTTVSLELPLTEG